MCVTMGRSMKKYTKHITENSWSDGSGCWNRAVKMGQWVFPLKETQQLRS
jgi:hypothetical protein